MNDSFYSELAKALASKGVSDCPMCGAKNSVKPDRFTYWVGTPPQENEQGISKFNVFSATCQKCGCKNFFTPEALLKE